MRRKTRPNARGLLGPLRGMRVTATDADDQEKNMNKLMTVIFAGAMLASVSAASASDQWAEERLKAKTGRYSPREESRRAELARTVKHGPEDCQAACCREHSSMTHQNSATTTGPTSEYLRAKSGRAVSAPPTRDHKQHASTSAETNSSNSWARAKFGRDVTQGGPTGQAPASTVTLAACHMCGRTACCDHI